MQAEAQSPVVPPKPTCHPFYKNSPCDLQWQNYNFAVQQHNKELLQQYVGQQKSQAALEASAPLQKQIADQQQEISADANTIANLQSQIQAQSVAANTAELNAHTNGLEQGAGIGMGATLLLFGFIFGVRRLVSGFSITKREPSKASAAAVGR